jgi:hypothetical protein
MAVTVTAQKSTGSTRADFTAVVAMKERERERERSGMSSGEGRNGYIVRGQRLRSGGQMPTGRQAAKE